MNAPGKQAPIMLLYFFVSEMENDKQLELSHSVIQ